MTEVYLRFRARMWSLALKAVGLDKRHPIRRLSRLIFDKTGYLSGGPSAGCSGNKGSLPNLGGTLMKTWTKPAVREQEVGLEVTSYLPAEIDII